LRIQTLSLRHSSVYNIKIRLCPGQQTDVLSSGQVLPAVVLGGFCLVSASHFPSVGAGDSGPRTPRCGLCDMRARETQETKEAAVAAAAGSKQTNAGRWVAAEVELKGFLGGFQGVPGGQGNRVWLAGNRSHTNARQNEATDNTRLRTCHTKRWRDNQWNLWSQQVQCQCQSQAESQSQAHGQNPTQDPANPFPKMPGLTDMCTGRKVLRSWRFQHKIKKGISI